MWFHYDAFEKRFWCQSQIISPQVFFFFFFIVCLWAELRWQTRKAFKLCVISRVFNLTGEDRSWKENTYWHRWIYTESWEVVLSLYVRSDKLELYRFLYIARCVAVPVSPRGKICLPLQPCMIRTSALVLVAPRHKRSVISCLRWHKNTCCNIIYGK